ncbi:MAG: hypothetical protein OXS30_12365 [Chloroflexota bacterium]|nr:hypothetical protein [Chloroflexota bacterium]
MTTRTVDQIETATEFPSRAHANFYDGLLSAEAIAQNLMRVERFVEQRRPLVA